MALPVWVPMAAGLGWGNGSTSALPITDGGHVKNLSIAAIVMTLLLSASGTAHAVVCGAGPYRAGCVGPNGAVGVRRPYGGYYGYHPYRHYGTHCAAGPYRAGCVGPNGGVVVRRPY